MYRFILAVVVSGLLALSACSPSFNWRETRLEGSSLLALLPCKPDRGSRMIPLAGGAVELHMSGCEAGGAMFAVSHADLQDADKAGVALAHWKAAMLENMHATSSQELPFRPRGASALPQPFRMVAQGSRPDGRPVAAQGAWFAQGAQVFHAVVYADNLNREAAETFFAGLGFQ